jgi:ankyrin repeat protein
MSILPFSHAVCDKRTTEEDVYRIRFKNSPMVAACEGGYIDIVEYLVENGYNIDHSDTNLPTPLFSACQYGNKAVVDFLLKRNCKVDAINKKIYGFYILCNISFEGCYPHYYIKKICRP